MTGEFVSTTRLSLIGFLVVLVITWFCYQPALSGAFQLDDSSNLSGLAAIEDSSSAAEFVMSGTAGPLGRPLALITFAMQAEQWQQGARAFLKVNLFIHLLNALILAACLYLLCLLRAVEREKAAVVAAVAASCWVIMPLLATASLLVVQRMTTLSAVFSLLGLFGYLLARRRLEVAPTSALIWMSISLTVGSILATLTKETGLLLPAYALVLEATVFRRPGSVAVRHWRIWQGVFLMLPTMIVIGYLASRFVYPDWAVARHGYTGWERLLTESRLLWVYLQKALLGMPTTLGIFQVPPDISRSLLEPRVLLAVVAWLGLAVAAIVQRRRWPLFSLAVLWYLAGHVLESTVFPLELYFEHRNYLPVVGPAYAIVTTLLNGHLRLRRAAMVVVPVYVLASAYFLYGFAALSGEPSTSARFWASRYPESVRAVSTMATYQLSEEGPMRALTTIDRFVFKRPRYGYLRIQELNLRCMVLPNEDHGVVIDELRRELPNVEFTYTAGTMLSQLFSTVIDGTCNGVDLATVTELAVALQSNPRYVLEPGYNQFHYKLLAGIARQQSDFKATIENLERAIAHRGSPELNMMMVTTLGGAGDFAGAREFIDNALERRPANPLWAHVWREDLAKLRAYVDELERYSDDAGTSDE